MPIDAVESGGSPQIQQTTRRGSYAKSEEVRRRIVRAAAEVLAASGFHATTFKEVARRAGVSERGIAYHFQTKEALLEAVMGDHARRRAPVVTKASGLAVFAAVLAVVEADSQLPGVVRLQTILGGEATAPDHPAHDHYRMRYVFLRMHIANAFTCASGAGQVSSELDADELAAGLVALLDGIQLQWLFDPGAVSARKIVEGYLAGILSKEAMYVVHELRANYVAEVNPSGSYPQD